MTTAGTDAATRPTPGRWWRLLTEPHASVQAPEERRRARLLASLVLVITPVSLLASLVLPYVAWGKTPLDDPVTVLGLIATANGFIIYCLSRTRHWYAAAILTVASGAFATWSILLVSGGTEHAGAAPYFLGIPVLLSSALLGMVSTIVLAVASLAVVLTLPQVIPSLAYVDVPNTSVFLLFLSAFIIMFAWVRQQDLHQIQEQARGLAESEERSRVLMENAPAVILMLDREGRVLELNRAVEGLDADEVVGQDVRDFVTPEARDEMDAHLERVFRTGETVAYEIQGQGPHGEVAWYSTRLGAIEQDGEVVAAVLITQDITRLKEAEVERQRAREAQQEVERLRDQDAFKTRFLNMAAHELATPLTPMRFVTRMLRTPERMAAVGETSVRTLERSVDRMERLVKDVLLAAKMEANRMEVDPRPTDLSTHLQEVLEDHRPAAEGRNVVLTLDAGEGSVEALVDPVRMDQVFGNLLDNAIKFTPSGGEVRVSLTTEDDMALISVSDTGMGIPPDRAKEVFEPFGQVHDRDRVTVPGTGLGLFVTRNIVELHGGSIRYESEGEGKGTTFEVRVPLASAHEKGGVPEEGAAKAEPTPDGASR